MTSELAVLIYVFIRILDFISHFMSLCVIVYCLLQFIAFMILYDI